MKRRSVPGLVVATSAILAAVLMSAASVASTFPAGSLWAVGHTENFGSEHILGPLVERFRGGSWHGISSPAVAGGVLNGVAAVGPANAWAVGGTGRGVLIEHWNGRSWARVRSPSSTGFDTLYGIGAASASDIWAVGTTGRSSVGGPPLILHWNGTSWTNVLSSAAGQLNAVSAVSADDAWAVGSAVHGATYGTLVLHWDGTAWSRVPSPNPDRAYDQLQGVAALSATDVWAVGCVGCSSRPSKTLIEHWNGSRWTRVRSPSPGTLGDFLTSVAPVSARNIWTVGETNSRAGVDTLIEHWNGSSWRRVPSPTPLGGRLGNLFLDGAVAVSPANVWAVGSYDTGRAWLTLAEHWNGSSWQQMTTADPSSANYLNGVS